MLPQLTPGQRVYCVFETDGKPYLRAANFVKRCGSWFYYRRLETGKEWHERGRWWHRYQARAWAGVLKDARLRLVAFVDYSGRMWEHEPTDEDFILELRRQTDGLAFLVERFYAAIEVEGDRLLQEPIPSRTR